jgi:hypothetical protein
MDWLKQIKPMDLIVEAPQIQILDFGEKFTIDDAAALMVQGTTVLCVTRTKRKRRANKR